MPEKKSTNFIFRELLNIGGWKRDIERFLVVYVLLALVLVGALMAGTYTKKISMRFSSPVTIVSHSSYSNLSFGIGFYYPEGYALDDDKQKKYGKNYLAGFKSKFDSRIGCDVRLNDTGVNFSKSDAEIAAAIKNDIAAHARGFKAIDMRRAKIDKAEAFRSEFLFVDPLGSILHITQVIASHGGKNYLLVCGSGESQYRYVDDDFNDFFQSFEWSK